MKKIVAALALGGAVAALTGCGGLEFVQDQRLTFSAPANDKLTTLPVTVSWSMKDFATDGAGGGEYAVFIDGAPVKVGKNIRSVLAKGVPFSEQELEQQRVYVTRNPKVVLTLVRNIPNVTQVRQHHTATVVLLDGSGTRRTESAWTRTFDLNAMGVS